MGVTGRLITVTLKPVGISESHLHRNEQIVLDLHPHWVMLVKAVVAVIVSTLVGIFLWMNTGEGTLSTILRWIGFLFGRCLKQLVPR